MSEKDKKLMIALVLREVDQSAPHSSRVNGSILLDRVDATLLCAVSAVIRNMNLGGFAGAHLDLDVRAALHDAWVTFPATLAAIADRLEAT